MGTSFSQDFEALCQFWPMPWQKRLYESHFSKGDLPSVIDLPTGLGKTIVMAIWLIARARRPDQVPTRLVYVVDRRTVVDQATDLALRLQKNCKQALDVEPPAISTLRGQFADNRLWSRDPSRPAIIIGTVDLIGSALLFSGYRSSYKRHPLEAGLLGQDSLLVLDEAHLSKPFEKLLCSIEMFQATRGNFSHTKPLRVIRMSATSGTSTDSKPPFTLQLDANGNLTGDEAKYETVVERFGAKKRLTITTLGEKEKLADRLATEAVKLAEDNSLRGKRIVVFARKPDDATKIAEAIRKHVVKSIDKSGAKPSKVKGTPYANCVEVLTGTMRGRERDTLVEKPVLKRFFDGNERPGEHNEPVFLATTSAGEVGFDLNADHMVCDATTIDSLIQRLGRVNRRGLGDAEIHIFVEPPKKEKAGKPKKLDGLDLAIANTIALLQGIPDGNVSPKNLAILKKSDTWTRRADNGKSAYKNACAPESTTVELTDILLDAWSMTSIISSMPGRPEVGPWLRGIADELPQTTIAWRIELDEPGFTDLSLEDIEEWFDTHRILTHETLSVPTSSSSEGSAEKWLMARWEQLGKALGEMERRRIGSRRVIIDRSVLKVMPLADLIDELNRGNTSSIRHADLILPASFGGIERGIGLLDAAVPSKPEDVKDADEQTRKTNANLRLIAPDVADAVTGFQRRREIVTKSVDGKTESHIIGVGTAPAKPACFVVELASDDEQTVRLISYIPKHEKLEYGLEKQTLQQHVGAVRREVDAILQRMSVCDAIIRAAQLAADFHDHGKNRERWQRTIGGMATMGTTYWMQQWELEGEGKHQCLGKSGDTMKRDPRGYRHEFGSLREFADAYAAGRLLDSGGKPINQGVFDLAMHLIATHHGRGRPHFPKGGFDPDCESRSDEIHTESIRRFAWLQRKYGWWQLAWLENLLRCADALASADQETEGNFVDSEGGAA